MSQNCCNVNRSNNMNHSIINEIKVSKKKNTHQPHSEMVTIKGGKFKMGSEDEDINPFDIEAPVRTVSVEDFQIDITTVTNREFQQFVLDTDYMTEAERYGWSFVFHLLIDEKNMKYAKYRAQQTPWWIVVEGATWKHPEGPLSDIDDRMDHPVVHVSWNDAVAYCKWAGKRLPTESEWEYAARGGLEQNRYPWGNELLIDGEHQCNIWQGTFPTYNSQEDGYLGTAPAQSFKPNQYGLYNMVGNVWEWCADTFDVNKPQLGKVMRGGSFLCHDSYCNRYRVSARTHNTPDSSASNIGFRCVKDLKTC